MTTQTATAPKRQAESRYSALTCSACIAEALASDMLWLETASDTAERRAACGARWLAQALAALSLAQPQPLRHYRQSHSQRRSAWLSR